jgi:hypothetical protein
MVLKVRVLGSGTFSPGARWMGFPKPAVAGIGVTPNDSASGSLLTVDCIVLLVKVLGSGTGSPGARLIGLPAPSVAGIGLMWNAMGSLDGVSAGGVKGYAPGIDSWDTVLSASLSDSLGTAPASAAVEDSGAAEDRV